MSRSFSPSDHNLNLNVSLGFAKQSTGLELALAAVHQVKSKRARPSNSNIDFFAGSNQAIAGFWKDSGLTAVQLGAQP